MTSKPRSQLEAHIERKCCELAEENGFEHIKLDRSKRKWPDRLFLGPYSQVLLVEFKRPGEIPKKQQASFHRKLARLGHQVHVVESIAQFEILLLD